MCEPVKTESSVLSFIPMIIFDIVLLLIMFFGLLILRRHGGGTIGLTHLLWRQVRTILTGRCSLNSLTFFFFRKGVIWLALATATELPPVVSPTSSLLLVPFILIDSLRRRCSLY
jgi:hypothetical protein